MTYQANRKRVGSRCGMSVPLFHTFSFLRIFFHFFCGIFKKKFSLKIWEFTETTSPFGILSSLRFYSFPLPFFTIHISSCSAQAAFPRIFLLLFNNNCYYQFLSLLFLRMLSWLLLETKKIPSWENNIIT